MRCTDTGLEGHICPDAPGLRHQYRVRKTGHYTRHLRVGGHQCRQRSGRIRGAAGIRVVSRIVHCNQTRFGTRQRLCNALGSRRQAHEKRGTLGLQMRHEPRGGLPCKCPVRVLIDLGVHHDTGTGVQRIDIRESAQHRRTQHTRLALHAHGRFLQPAHRALGCTHVDTGQQDAGIH